MYICVHVFIKPRVDRVPLFKGAATLRSAQVHMVSITRFPSFRTQPLENLSVDSVKKWIPVQPSPWRKS